MSSKFNTYSVVPNENLAGLPIISWICIFRVCIYLALCILYPHSYNPGVLFFKNGFLGEVLFQFWGKLRIFSIFLLMKKMFFTRVVLVFQRGEVLFKSEVAIEWIRHIPYCCHFHLIPIGLFWYITFHMKSNKTYIYVTYKMCKGMAYYIQFLETPQSCFCIKKPTYLSIYYNYKESSMLWKLEKGIYSSIYRSQQKGRAHHIKLGRTILHSRPSSCLLCALQLNCTCTVIVFCRFQYNFMQNTIEMMFDTTQIRSKKFRYAEIPKLVSNLQESRSKQLKFFREATWSLWLGKIIFLRATKTNPTYPISILPTYKVKLEDWVFSEPFNEIKKVRQYLMQNRPTTFFSVILYSSYSFT